MKSSSPVPKMLLIAPAASLAGQDNITALGRYFDLDVVFHDRGEKALALRVLNRLLMKRPDVLLMWMTSPQLSLLLTLIAKLLGTKVVFLTDNPGTLGTRGGFTILRISLFQRLLRWNLAFADQVVAYSQAGRYKSATGDATSHSDHRSLAEQRQSDLVRLVGGIVNRENRIGIEPSALPVMVDLGCGSLQRPGFLGIDSRPTSATAIVADAQALPLAGGTVDLLYATCLLEHFDAPSRVLTEVHRVLKPTGEAVFRLPNLGTYSSHLDTTHRFLADLALWRSLFNGYFGYVEVRPLGTKYRDSPSLVAVNWLLVNGLKWYELAQGWDFVCREPRVEPVLTYIGWWEEGEHEGRIGGEIISAVD